jgi:asparagine synthase (glutamine-hydrolysing)
MRDVAKQIGLPEKLTELKRSAAQYSSGIGKILSKIIKDKKEKYKGTYLSKILGKKNIKLGSLFSSGKDSIYALHIQERLNYEISCLITIDSHNKDSFMFHTPTIEIAEKQAECLNIPIILEKTKGEEEKELIDLKNALKKAKEKFQIQGVITGALFSNYQRTRIEEICDKINLKCYSPLWHMNQEIEMKNLIENGFNFIMTKVAAEGLDKSWLGKKITQKELTKLKKLNKKLHINIAGEGGEFETLVLDAPLFNKKINIKDSSIEEEKEGSATLIIKKIEFKKKD